MSLPSGETISIGGVTCQELAGSGSVELTADGPSGMRNFLCDWDDRFALARELLGYVRSDNKEPPQFFRVAPATFPEYGAGDVLFCQKVAINGVGTMSKTSAGAPSYVYARLDASYGPPRGQESDGDTGEEEVIATLDIDYHSEFHTFGSFEYYWATSEQKVAEPLQLGKLIVILDKTVSQRGLPSIPEASIREHIGKVNENEWQGCAAETLLFVGATSRRTYSAEGKVMFDVTYHFKERPAASWNKFYNSAEDSWEQLKRIGADGMPSDNPVNFFETTDFGAWFNAPIG
jgi:hypothetical protein